MNNFIEDSGQAKRYSNFKSIDDNDFQKIFTIAKQYEEYKTKIESDYKLLSIKILSDTKNYKEKAIIIDKNNNILLEKVGERNLITFTSQELKLMDGNRLIHNHPSSMTLSEADIKLALDYGLKEIVAFSGKGKFYKLTITNKQTRKELVLQYENSKKEVQNIMLKLRRDKKITPEHIKAEYQHFVTSLFSKNSKGVKYEISN